MGQQAAQPAASASMAASSAPKIMRIGVIQAGRIIEEKLIRSRSDVTIGSSTRNTFTLFASSLPHSFVIFHAVGGRYLLQFTEDMDGRIAVGDRVLPLLQLMQEGLARQRGNVYQIPLQEESRGKVIIGDLTVLFQFVTPPPPRPRPQLPPSIRGGFMTGIDWTFASCILGVMLAQGAFLVYLNSVDWPKEIAIDQVPDRFAKYVVVQKPKPVEVKKADTAADAAKKAEKPEKKASDEGESSHKKKKEAADPAAEAAKAQAAAEAKARADAERRARLAEQLSHVGALKVLGAKGSGGTVADLVARGGADSDADAAFKNVGGVSTASSGGGKGLLGGSAGGTGHLATIEDFKGTSGPASVGTGEKSTEKAVKAVLKEAIEAPDGNLSADEVGKVVRRGLGGLRDCYERALKGNPSLTGKVEITLTIGPTGGVTKVEMGGSMDDSSVTSCMETMVKRWRFPAPEGGGTVTVPFSMVLQAAQ